MRRLPAVAFALLVAVCSLAPRTPAGAVLGDYGHFLSYWPRIHLANPDGEAFTVTMHLMRWPVAKWNPDRVQILLTAPTGAVLVAGEHQVPEDGTLRLEIPAGPAGVYRLEPYLSREGKRIQRPHPNFWLETSLSRAVVWTGDPAAHATEGRRLVTACAVPRRWWFWVPPRTRTFRAIAQRAERYMSQREDWGLSILNPRGQRRAVLWGQPTVRAESYRQEMIGTIEIEPGEAGRFWAVEIRHGDSHNYSNINLALDGVPPYLARSPEEWFDPESGAPPELPVYDETPFMQFARTERSERFTGLRHFSPAPSLGDPDGVQVRGDGRFALWNPQGRDLALRVGTYLPRGLGTEAAPERALLRVRGPEGEAVLEERIAMGHLHGKHGAPAPLPRSPAGVLEVTVGGAERWFAFTYPATPLVWRGEEGTDGWQRFTFEAGTARNWYFRVPDGTESFRIRAAAQHPEDVFHLAINAPDRTVDLLYGREAESTIEVPDGLDGKLWHLRPDVGSASRLRGADPAGPRYLGVYLELELNGVPGLLAPTPGQWFDPETKRRALP